VLGPASDLSAVMLCVGRAIAVNLPVNLQQSSTFELTMRLEGCIDRIASGLFPFA
jgi:hypothetical protein